MNHYVITATDLLGNIFIYVGNHDWKWSEAPIKNYKVYKQRRSATYRMREEMIYDLQYRYGVYIAYHVRLYDGIKLYGEFQE